MKLLILASLLFSSFVSAKTVLVCGNRNEGFTLKTTKATFRGTPGEDFEYIRHRYDPYQILGAITYPKEGIILTINVLYEYRISNPGTLKPGQVKNLEGGFYGFEYVNQPRLIRKIGCQAYLE